MLRTKAQDRWYFGSREDDFKKYLTFKGIEAILVMTIY